MKKRKEKKNVERQFVRMTSKHVTVSKLKRKKKNLTKDHGQAKKYDSIICTFSSK